MLSGAIASCIARTASKSPGQVSRISTVVPSARSAYTGPVSCAVLIGFSLAKTAPVTCLEDGTRDDRVDVRIAEAIADRHHAGDVSCLADQGVAEGGGLRG